MRGVEAVLAAGARHDAVVAAVVLAMLVAQFAQLAVAILPVDRALLFLGQAAGVADAVVIEMDRRLRAVARVLEFHGRVGALV